MIKNLDFVKAADFLLISSTNETTNSGTPHVVSAVGSSKRTRKGNGTRNKPQIGKVNVGPKTGTEVRYYKRDKWFVCPKNNVMSASKFVRSVYQQIQEKEISIQGLKYLLLNPY